MVDIPESGETGTPLRNARVGSECSCPSPDEALQVMEMGIGVGGEAKRDAILAAWLLTAGIVAMPVRPEYPRFRGCHGRASEIYSKISVLVFCPILRITIDMKCFLWSAILAALSSLIINVSGEDISTSGWRSSRSESKVRRACHQNTMKLQIVANLPIIGKPSTHLFGNDEF